MKNLLSLLIVALGLISFVGTANADVKSQKKSEKTNDWDYHFDDDLLNSTSWSSNDAIIKIRPKAARATLIRPRTNFIPELLKSVESI